MIDRFSLPLTDSKRCLLQEEDEESSITTTDDGDDTRGIIPLITELGINETNNQ